MLILGINEGANSSVVICKDGRACFALQEERISRRKEHSGFPTEALRFALNHQGLAPEDFDAVCLSNLSSPGMTRTQFLRAYDLAALSYGEALAQGGWRSVAAKAFPGARRVAPMQAPLAAAGFGQVPMYRTAHHSNHAASAYFGRRQNPRDPHLVLSLDSGGDGDCARVYRAENGRLTLLARTAEGHSIGQIYGQVTHMLGMTPHEHEYKLMGMAPYADPNHITSAVERFSGYLDLDPQNPLCFKRRVPEDTGALERRLLRDFKRARFDSLAGAIQTFTEDLLVRWVQACIKQTGLRKVVAAGGVFMNVKANKRIAELPEVEFFDVFPSCGDETLPFGAVWQACLRHDPRLNEAIGFDDIYLGPDAGHDLEAAKRCFADQLTFETVADPALTAARLLAAGEVVARVTGRLEFGARALGNRSLLADPGQAGVIQRINKMIKLRDFWMPFAPASTEERGEEYVVLPKSLAGGSPYMMHSFDSRENRDGFFAGTHPYDNTARLQFVSKHFNPGFHDVITEFAKLTGKAIVLNTSFNLHGSPVVLGSADAMTVMVNSGLDYLLIDHTLVTKRAG